VHSTRENRNVWVIGERKDVKTKLQRARGRSLTKSKPDGGGEKTGGLQKEKKWKKGAGGMGKGEKSSKSFPIVSSKRGEHFLMKEVVTGKGKRRTKKRENRSVRRRLFRVGRKECSSQEGCKRTFVGRGKPPQEKNTAVGESNSFMQRLSHQGGGLKGVG